MKKAAIIMLTVILAGLALAQPPEPPHRVYGEINDTDGPVDDLDVEFRYSGDSKASTTTDSSGSYSVKIPYSSTYDGENLELYVEDGSTGETVTFSSGASTKLNYTGKNLRQDSFNVTGKITINGSTDSGYVVSAYHDSNNITSDTTDSDGDYKLVVPFSDDYDGEQLSLYVRGVDTGNTFTFQTGESTSIDYGEDNTDDSDDSTDSTNTDDNTTDDSTNDDEDSNTDDSSDGDSNNDSDSSGSTSFSINGISVSPQVVEVGETFTIEAILKNTGDAAGSYTLELQVGGETVTRKVPELAAGEQTTVEITETFDEAGDYTIGSGDTTAELTVEESSGDGLSLFQMMGLASLLMFLFVGLYKGYQMVGGGSSSGGDEEESQGAFDSFRSQKEQKGDSFNWRYQDEE